MLTRWNEFELRGLEPGFAALNGLRHEVDRLFRHFENQWSGEAPLTQGAVDGNQPQIQLRDMGEEFHVIAEVPGFSTEDLHIALEQASLTIRGQRSDEAFEGYSVHRRERGLLRFARAFTLPARVDADKIEAKLANGILELRLPKAAEERPRTIAVKAA
jgi:HSP20 family protein